MKRAVLSLVMLLLLAVPAAAQDVAAQLASGNVDCALGFDPSIVSASK